MKKIGILGGTFDPIHLGHLLLAEQALVNEQLDEVWFIPANIPPHKNPSSVTNALHRAKMVRLAIADHPHFVLSLVELDREGPSYTIDTLQILVDKHPFFRFFLILGTDMMKDLPKWYKIKEILQIADIISLHRVGFNDRDIPDFLMNRIRWINEGVMTNLSSSLIRDRILHSLSVRYMLPLEVWQYMKEHSLYETR